MGYTEITSGECTGAVLGIVLGSPERNHVGTGDGSPLGWAVGKPVGGLEDGEHDGIVDGVEVGIVLGSPEGHPVGTTDGTLLGDKVELDQSLDSHAYMYSCTHSYIRASIRKYI